MSFARFALRIAALRALDGATLAGDNVRDSDINAIDISADGSMSTDQRRPFVVVYTDDSTAEDADLRDLRQTGAIDFVCEFGVASTMTTINPATGESDIVPGAIAFPATDAAFEMILDLVARQIVVALTGPDPWAELWKRLSTGTLRIEQRRAASSDDGTRIAARQMRIPLDLRPDPVWGQELNPGTVWGDFLAALQAADPELAIVAASFVGPQEGAVTAETIRRSRGHTAAERDALGYGPEHPGGEAWTIDTVVLEEEIGG